MEKNNIQENTETSGRPPKQNQFYLSKNVAFGQHVKNVTFAKNKFWFSEFELVSEKVQYSEKRENLRKMLKLKCAQTQIFFFFLNMWPKSFSTKRKTI